MNPILLILLILAGVLATGAVRMPTSDERPDQAPAQPGALDAVRLTGAPPHGRADFVAWLGPAARTAQRATGIPASVTVAMAAYETDFGRSWLANRARNLFGVTAAGAGIGNDWWNGERVARGGRTWRVYPSYRHSLLDYHGLFYRLGAYSRALAYRTAPRQFAGIIVPTYAPRADSNVGYLAAVHQIMDEYDLERFDVPAAEWALDPRLVPARHIETWQAAVAEDRQQAAVGGDGWGQI